MMNAPAMFAKAAAAAPIMVLRAIRLHIVADIKAVSMAPVRIEKS